MNYIDKFYKRMIKWKDSPNCKWIRFEYIIGPEGGSTREKQLDTLWEIANYLNANVTQETINAVATQSYLARPPLQFEGTFHEQGKIGTWKQFFNEEHKKIFKASFGKELIELGYEKDNHW